ncbi:MAG: DUF4783 domain-containing protein [Saprospiraceae bacterium]|nr:DUF4783 domain-containing protein [Saprospiraceae bacterium]MBK8668242.1 DUF4783 domain-containing protein [Saprospiraceae bacterium]MBL0099281.1 DUF4783 domain-containing protein [Saprospiraceae bacterium]
MKNFLIICLLALSSQVFSQNETAFFSAFKAADATAMESYLEDNIDFCLFEDQQIMNKKAALTKLKAFLATNKILSVEVIHKGASKDRTSQYKVAKMTTSKDTFRVFVYASGEIGAKTIKEIRIDKF